MNSLMEQVQKLDLVESNTKTTEQLLPPQINAADALVPQENSESLCRGCGKDSLEIFDGCVLVCTLCGLENEKVIKAEAEWRTAEKSRCMIITYPGSSMSTAVKGFSKFNKNANSMKYSDRKQMEATNEFKEISEKSNIPESIIKTALSFFSKVSCEVKANNRKLIKRGGNLQGIKASCLYLSYVSHKKEGLFKTQKDIADIFDIKVSYLHSNLPIVQKIVQVNCEEYSGYKDFINNCFDEYNKLNTIKIPDRIKTNSLDFIIKHKSDKKLQTFMNKSVSCGLFYLFLKSNKKDYPLENMITAWKISKVTIQKVEKVLATLQS